MSQPSCDRHYESLGRRFRANFHCEWTAGASDNLDTQLVVSLDDVSGKFDNTRFAVESVAWASSANVRADIYFDSMPMGPSGLIHTIASDSAPGEVSFIDWYPNGAIADPNRLSPGNVVVSTRGAQQGEELTILITGREKGKSR